MLPPAPLCRLPLLALALGLSSVLAAPATAEQAAALARRDAAGLKSKSRSLSASRASASKARSLASKSKSLSRSRSARDATSSKKAASKTASASRASASKAKSASRRSSSLSKASASKSKASASKSKSTKTTTTKAASATSTAASALCFKYDDVDPHVSDYKEGLSSTNFNTCSVACETEVAYVGLHETDYCFCLDLDDDSYKTLSKKKVSSSYCEPDYAHVGDYVSVSPSTIEYNGNTCDATEDGPLLGPKGCESNCFPAEQIAASSVPYTFTLPSSSNFVSAPLLCQYACSQRELYQYFAITETKECYCLGTVGAGPAGTTKYNVTAFGSPVAYGLCDGEEHLGSADGSLMSLYATDYKFV